MFLALLGLFACHKPVQKKIPIANFFQTPERSYFRISPDGRFISYLTSYKSKPNLYVQSLVDGRGYMATQFTDNAVSDYFWTYTNQIVFTQDVVTADSLKMYLLNTHTLKTRPLLAEYKVKLRVLNVSQSNPDVLTIGLNKRDESIFDVYHLDMKTGKLSLYITNPGDITEWVTDNDGRIRLARASDGVNTTILYRNKEEDAFRPVVITNFRNAIRPIATTRTDGIFYALSNLNQDKMALVKVNAATSKQTAVIYTNPRADIQNVEYDKARDRLDYVAWDEAKPRRHFFNDSVKLVYDKLERAFGNGETRIIDRNNAESKFIVFTSSDHNPGTYYLYDNRTDKVDKLGDANPDIDPEQLADMKPIKFKASDGLEIYGYLTLPNLKKQEKLPMVVMPHNGMWSRNSWGYNAEVQFLANRGYAVLQINFRGSAGYGKAFRSAGYKQVGGKMQQDITDGVKWAIEQNIADPKRVAIYGGGFGGFCALYGVSYHPELYRCAVVQNGLINFFSYIKDAPPYFKPYLKMIYEMVGNPETEAEQLRAISPVFHTDKIKVPLLMFQGGKDARANITELNQFVLELRKKGVPVNYMLKDDERSYFRNEANRLEMYTEIEAFLEANLHGRK